MLPFLSCMQEAALVQRCRGRPELEKVKGSVLYEEDMGTALKTIIVRPNCIIVAV